VGSDKYHVDAFLWAPILPFERNIKIIRIGARMHLQTKRKEKHRTEQTKK